MTTPSDTDALFDVNLERVATSAGDVELPIRYYDGFAHPCFDIHDPGTNLEKAA